MNKKFIYVAALVVVVMLIGAGLLLRSSSSAENTKQDLASKYGSLALPGELALTSQKYASNQWTFTYHTSASRSQAYDDLVKALKSAGFSTGGQTGEFIFTNAGNLAISATFEPADTSKPLTDIQIIVQEPAQI